jgi:meso-butanediol dehydrogenase/(S,S)-butanediol dehydrogenase/diacetyl reductase
MQLEGKVAIISGGGTGIGAATAATFAREGADVVVTGRRREPLEEVASQTGGVAVAGDATDPAHATEAVRVAVDRFGGLDIVVANAGVGYGGTAGDVDDERWHRTIDVNLNGPLYLVRAALPTMIERAAGSIVLISSVNGFVAGPDSAAYVSSKTGLIGLARSIAVDYGPQGIRANAVCPGWVVTPMADEEMDEVAGARGIDRAEAYRLSTLHVPLRRPATPAEIAACCLFLASDASSIVTGTTLIADGGTTATDVASAAFGLDV